MAEIYHIEDLRRLKEEAREKMKIMLVEAHIPSNSSLINEHIIRYVEKQKQKEGKNASDN